MVVMTVGVLVHCPVHSDFHWTKCKLYWPGARATQIIRLTTIKLK